MQVTQILDLVKTGCVITLKRRIMIPGDDEVIMKLPNNESLLEFVYQSYKFGIVK